MWTQGKLVSKRSQSQADIETLFKNIFPNNTTATIRYRVRHHCLTHAWYQYFISGLERINSLIFIDVCLHLLQHTCTIVCLCVSQRNFHAFSPSTMSSRDLTQITMFESHFTCSTIFTVP